jgi:hypothetical protein
MNRREFLKLIGIGAGGVSLFGMARKEESPITWVHPDGSFVKITANWKPINEPFHPKDNYGMRFLNTDNHALYYGTGKGWRKAGVI